MFKRLRNYLLIQLLTHYVRLVGRTLRHRCRNPERIEAIEREHGNYIFATWHSNIFYVTWLLRGRGYHCLISPSRDGDAIYEVMRRFGFTAARGSSGRDGVKGLKDIVRALKKGHHAALTPDGPRGPIHKVKPGVILMAKMSGAPILPWTCNTQRQWRMRSWDRHKFPKPFAHTEGLWGEPLFVPPDISHDEIPKYCELLEERLMRISLELEPDLEA